MIDCRFVVSAAGPWVDELRQIDRSLQGKRLFLSKGVHIVVPHRRFPVRQAVYFDTFDGRMIFAVPRQRITYIGTTDTPYQGDLQHVSVDREDVDYLLKAVNSMFPEVQLKTGDVESSWAGLRPLIREEGKSASEMSRRDEIFESPSGLLSIAGGKLTGYRKMAGRIVDLVGKKLRLETGRELGKSRTHEIALAGGPFANAADVNAYRDQVAGLIRPFGLSAYHADYLVGNYGRQAQLILDRFSSFNNAAEVALARSEAWFAIHHELAGTLLDFFNRRTGRLYFDLPTIPSTLPAVAADFARYLGWDDERLKGEKASVERAVREAGRWELESTKGYVE
jgi:glycerol-3-phosphate dehydrogenase